MPSINNIHKIWNRHLIEKIISNRNLLNYRGLESCRHLLGKWNDQWMKRVSQTIKGCGIFHAVSDLNGFKITHISTIILWTLDSTFTKKWGWIQSVDYYILFNALMYYILVRVTWRLSEVTKCFPMFTSQNFYRAVPILTLCN